MDGGSIGVDTTGFSLALKPSGIGSFLGPSDTVNRSSSPESEIRDNLLSMTALSASPNERRMDEMDFFSKSSMEVDVKTQPYAVKNEDLTVNTGLRLLLTTNTGSDESTVDDGTSRNEDGKVDGSDELESMKMELEQLTKENQRLHGMLNEITSNYNTLHTQLVTLMQQREQHIPRGDRDGTGTIVPRQFMDLGLATGNDERSNSSTEVGSPLESGSPVMDYRLQARNGSPFELPKVAGDISGGDREGSSDVAGTSQCWIPNKLPKLTPTRNPTAPATDQAQEATMRKARVSVRARSEAPMITDGCQWRKYGQKMAKGNPCPRAYYRCTMAAGCPVRKQVQRCAEDRSILITTYEGNHNHPLPPAAMAMASTTSAAASMLLSGSMPSPDGGLMNPNFLARTLLPCSSNLATISASAPFPTVTLDLTHTPTLLQQSQRPANSQFPVPIIGAAATPAAAPQIFGQSLYSNQSKFSGLQSSSSSLTHEMAVDAAIAKPPNPPFVDSVSAATAAITSDPNFTAALAAAITSIIGAGGSGTQQQPINGSPASATNNNSRNANQS